jgi:glycosyltransferase involved in cell wall biosynthesis
MRILHAIHDFLPRHRAGSELYALALCRELAARHHLTLLCADYDLSRAHGHVTWRVYDGLPVVEIANNWVCRVFEDTYRPPLVGERVAQILDAVQPEIVHVHSLLNLSFDLPALARARGARVVATLHDYTLVCPAGGQRLHRAEAHVCRTIDTARCARCVPESPQHELIPVATLAARGGISQAAGRAAAALSRRLPRLAGRARRAVRRAAPLRVAAVDVDRRLEAARRVFDEVDLFVAPSSSLAWEFGALGIPAPRLRVSDYGFAPLGRRARGPARRPLRIGYVGSLVWHKGVHVLIDAVRGLPTDAYILRVFGDPAVDADYSADLRERAAGLPVSFMGVFGSEQTAEVYEDIDVLVVPSLWLENSPLVIHEAFMAGVPVVGARIGGIADLVDHDRNGLLYEPQSSDALTAILRDLIDRPGRLAALADMAPAIKSIADDAREWEAVYADVLNGQRPVAAAT